MELCDEISPRWFELWFPVVVRSRSLPELCWPLFSVSHCRARVCGLWSADSESIHGFPWISEVSVESILWEGVLKKLDSVGLTYDAKCWIPLD